MSEDLLTMQYSTRRLRVDLHRKMKSLAALKGLTMEDMLNEVLEIGLREMLSKKVETLRPEMVEQ